MTPKEQTNKNNSLKNTPTPKQPTLEGLEITSDDLQTPTQKQYFGLISEALGFDTTLMTKRERGAVARLAGELVGHHDRYSPEVLRGFILYWWANDWHRRNNIYPTLSTIKSDLSKYLKSLSQPQSADPDPEGQFSDGIDWGQLDS